MQEFKITKQQIEYIANTLAKQAPDIVESINILSTLPPCEKSLNEIKDIPKDTAQK